MPYEFKATRRVEFSETDLAGIVHYSNFFRFMETAEHGFYRSLGFSVILAQFQPPLGFPRVHAECDYLKPLRFEDLVEIQLLVLEKRAKTLRYLFLFRKINHGLNELVAKGKLTIVCVQHQPGGVIASVAIPPEVAEKIEAAPPERLNDS